MKTTTKIARAALAAGLATASAQDQSGDKPKATPEARFAKMDTDHDGKVTKEEFMGTKRGQENPEKAAQKFGSMDSDKNSSISLDEFKAAGDKKAAEKTEDKGGE